MRGCDRCGHLKRLHNIVSGTVVDGRLCSAVIKRRSTTDGQDHLCWCPKYLKPGTMR